MMKLENELKKLKKHIGKPGNAFECNKITIMKVFDTKLLQANSTPSPCQTQSCHRRQQYSSHPKNFGNNERTSVVYPKPAY
ncbi:hypothetical protein DC498_21015 [Terrimonas sp.]|uniref:hypothetical protein n=1 Tax=Terrimonas sp. TaxID=1914338 RepID=UPI000D51B91B|nr:hypothetical protein [Terrimonas sp.]PVD50209.1 hypothetical protein DC498_21015 [Terrimonas sp.]